MVQVLRVRRGVLRADRIRRRDVGQRHSADNYGVHRGTLRGHLSSVPVTHRFQVVQSCQVCCRHLAAGSLPGRASGDTVWCRNSARRQQYRVRRDSAVHNEVGAAGARVRNLNAAVLRRSNDADHRAVCADRNQTAEVPASEEAVAEQRCRAAEHQEPEPCDTHASCCSGGVLRVLGSVPLAEVVGRVREQQDRPQCRCRCHIQRSHLRLGHSILPLHHSQPCALSYHVAQVQGSFQVYAGAAVR